MQSDGPLVLYHAGCKDGFCAAWVAFNALGRKAELVPVSYGNPPPGDCKNRDIYMLDFSYSREIIEEMASCARSILILDHHKTAEEILKGLPYAKFDMNRSGAGITWDYFYPTLQRHWLVDYVEDRDIWKWALPESREVNAFITSLPYEVEAWDLASGLEVPEATRIGRTHLRRTEAYCEVMVDHAMMLCDLGSYINIPTINAPTEQISELMEVMLARTKAPFAMAWRMRKDGSISVSLRSVKGAPNEVDVSEHAKAHGGGGHKNAAGFEVPYDDLLEFMDSIVPGEQREKDDEA